MNKMIIDGVEVKTNYTGKSKSYPIGDGYGKSTMTMILMAPRETELDVLKRLVRKGYTRVTFYEETTCVRGYHKLYAFAK